MNKEVISTDQTETIGSTKAFKFNLFDPKVHINPYPAYHHLRSESPVHQNFVGGGWLVTRYADVKAILRSGYVRSQDKPKSIQERNKYLQDKGKNLNALAHTASQLLFYMDPPDHTRLRSLVVKVFSPVVVERMRPRIQEIVDELLDKVRHKGSMDIIADFAIPLPVTVISRLLGIPQEDQDQLNQWSNVFARILDSLVSLEEFEAMNEVTEAFQEYLRALIAKREKQPQADLISALITAREQTDKLSQEELLATCIMLFTTGEESTVNTIGNGMLALLNHPDQIEQLKREPTMIQSAVEEILRYDSPVQITTRIATVNFEIGNQTIQAGEKVVLCLGAANRDPEQFPDPDRLNINRDPNPHVAFGDGIHYCLGAGLARIQAQIAVNTLIQQFPDLKLASDKLEWRKNVVLRGLKALPVNFTI
ncbi:cytochrome P450 [Nostoc favosum]|uniref:Cytochrome P450 n=1 Tax=Nostoc favosum CHAB5714 TaxID=2780399 RepID=A0ABS8IAZ8_9NOSO|nr:cytochrome P450 [Nostoc favosum]MCC5600914.1 cytochrome P450 [Nostoc favosum CHAB5714]